MIPDEIQLHILYFKQKSDPSKSVRILEPLYYLEKRGHKIYDMESAIASGSSEKVFHEMNMILISNIDITPSNFDSFQRLAEFCHHTGKLIVYDFDDIYFDVPDYNPHQKRTLPWDFIQKVIPLANLLTVTGTDLYQAMRKFHSRISILPNMIDFQKYQPRPQINRAFRIGWAGGGTHLRDIPLALEAVKLLQKKYAFEFILFGLTEDYSKLAETIRSKNIPPGAVEDPFDQDFIQFVHHLNGIMYQSKPVVTYAEFPDELRRLDLDIGLCPIQDTLFNRCRSGIKFYQYAAVQTLTLASKIYPYSEEPAVLAENTTEDWTRQLEMLITNKTFREEAMKLQHSYVFSQRNYEKNILLWEKLYQNGIARLGKN